MDFPVHSHLQQRNEKMVAGFPWTLNKYKQASTIVITTLNMSVHTTGKSQELNCVKSSVSLRENALCFRNSDHGCIIPPTGT